MLGMLGTVVQELEALNGNKYAAGVMPEGTISLLNSLGAYKKKWVACVHLYPTHIAQCIALLKQGLPCVKCVEVGSRIPSLC